MSVIGELLFWSGNGTGAGLDDVLRHHGNVGVQQLVDKLSEREFSAKSDEDLVTAIMPEVIVEPLKVDFEKGEPHVTETSVDARSVFGEQIRMKGLRATKTFPFSGNPDLWKWRTNPFDHNPPRGEVNGRTVTVGMEIPENESDQALAYIEDSTRRIRVSLNVRKLRLRRSTQLFTIWFSSPFSDDALHWAGLMTSARGLEVSAYARGQRERCR